MSPSKRSTALWKSVVLFLAIGGLMAGVVLLQNRQFDAKRLARPFQEKMYLPDSKKLQVAALGFDNFYADLLWLRAIQAFGGKWHAGGGDMSPIFHYFDVVTDLDPHFIEAYKLGNLVIGDEGGDYRRSLDILRKGMARNPGNWELPYLGIYNSVWQMGDYEEARWFARMASKVPGRPEFVARMGEFVERRSGRVEIAYRMNMQYILGYLDQNNSIEAKISGIRFWDILDRWYRNAMIEACRNFIKENDRDPISMDELIASSAWKPFEAPTMERIARAIEKRREAGLKLEPEYEKILEESLTLIKGIPPEPHGYEYVILEEWVKQINDPATTGTIVASRDTADILPETHFDYIVNTNMIINHLVDYVMGMNDLIQSYQRENGRWPASMEELVKGNFNYHDPLGGEFHYDPLTGLLTCTTLENPTRRREPIYIF